MTDASPRPSSGLVPGTIRVSPNIDQTRDCPHCGAPLTGGSIVWHGMHVLISDRCAGCGTEVMTDLKVGHASLPHQVVQVDMTRQSLHGVDHPTVKRWLGEKLLGSLLEPSSKDVVIERKCFRECARVVILNCIDHLYGHTLLKLLNAQRHLDASSDLGLIVLVPKSIAWMAPEGVAEIWTVDIPLKDGQAYYPSLDRSIHEQCRRFREVYVSRAFSHPRRFDIAQFTRVPVHEFRSSSYRITFVWREDRLWESIAGKVLRRVGGRQVALARQSRRITSLFEGLRRELPEARFTVAGLGRRAAFPSWIDDVRVDTFDVENERALCRIYAESRLVIGVHGSNMLLPSAHAGMTVDLMPPDRWGNFAQDILYPAVDTDPRLTAFRYRYLPMDVSTAVIGRTISGMIDYYPDAYMGFTLEERSIESEAVSGDRPYRR